MNNLEKAAEKSATQSTTQAHTPIIFTDQHGRERYGAAMIRENKMTIRLADSPSEAVELAEIINRQTQYGSPK
ncbi:hypothetical protein HW450_06605 [Corynebacterium hindlerae]|uniref:Uncharacterized protein n=1 Tax=Corynebacterium hindlerae TaxID=699041 RepID=A0A7G5FIC0_9CORY|nr:hypothetical protein [Corynebacterium hindlerae]QMV86361.1 hypothetical protein HW450_06605 [Corynebacterium hindlerae]